jgi:hypothetical protein
VLSARVAELRPVYLPPDPASRTAYTAGDSPSAICGSRRCTFRWALGRRVNRRCCRC